MKTSKALSGKNHSHLDIKDFDRTFYFVDKKCNYVNDIYQAYKNHSHLDIKDFDRTVYFVDKKCNYVNYQAYTWQHNISSVKNHSHLRIYVMLTECASCVY